MSIDKQDTFNRVVLLAIITIVVTSLFNLSCIPAVSIGVGLLAGITSSLAYFKVTSIKQFLIDLIPILLGSQIGWAALLI